MQGEELWQDTTSAVTTALRDDGVVNITTLETLAPLWETFNEAAQDDAAHFLQQLVHLAKPTKVITQYHHVDHRQEVHLRAAFPTHLIYPEDVGEEFETLISTWANTAEGQVLSGRGLWVAQIGRHTHRQGEWKAPQDVAGPNHLSTGGLLGWRDHYDRAAFFGGTALPLW